MDFEVPGKPVGQGSMRDYGYGITHSNPNLQPWRERVGWQARHRLPPGWDLDGPMAVDAWFHLPRPKHHYRANGDLKPAAPWWPVSRAAGDVDKHARALLDALTGVVWADDSQVVQLHAEKTYDDGAGPRLVCTVQHLTEKG